MKKYKSVIKLFNLREKIVVITGGAGFLGGKHAEGIAVAVTELSRIFPEGSDVGESESLPLIWDEPETFADAIRESKEAATAFVTAAQSGDRAAISKAFRNLGGSCRGCHDQYRVKN